MKINKERTEKGKIILRKNGPIFQYIVTGLRNGYGESPSPYDASLTSKKLKSYQHYADKYECEIINCSGKKDSWKLTSGELKGWKIYNGLEVEAVFVDNGVEVKCLLD